MPKTSSVARVKKLKPAIPLTLPEVLPGIHQWLIVGLDPSLSRTGYALMSVTQSVLDAPINHWLEVGSLKPENASDPVWVRSKAMAIVLQRFIHSTINRLDRSEPTGLIISMEAPTPRNDFLTSISRIFHLVLLDDELPKNFVHTFVQMTNASTLRSLMGLTKTGAKNKVENVAKAYEFLKAGGYPNLDTDACDAVLMAMMARYSAALLMGNPALVPERFLQRLCDGRQETTGKGLHRRTRAMGILHRPEYWCRYERQQYVVLLRDAKVKKARLERWEVSI